MRRAFRLQSPLRTYVCACLLLLGVGCAPIALTRPLTKLGLIAPFEGQRRAQAYEALYAVKLALQERNAAQGAAGWAVELVALDPGDDAAQHATAARMMLVDPDVTYALLVLDADERASVTNELSQRGLPHALISQADPARAPSDAAFVERYRALSGGGMPGPLAARAYAAAQDALARIEQQVRAHGRPVR